VVSCTIDPATPAPTPADAVAIFRASSPPFQAAPEVDPLQWSVDAPIAYDRDWPFTGSFAPTLRADPPWAPTALSNDGMSLWDFPLVYRSDRTCAVGGTSNRSPLVERSQVDRSSDVPSRMPDRRATRRRGMLATPEAAKADGPAPEGPHLRLPADALDKAGVHLEAEFPRALVDDPARRRSSSGFSQSSFDVPPILLRRFRFATLRLECRPAQDHPPRRPIHFEHRHARTIGLIRDPGDPLTRLGGNFGAHHVHRFEQPLLPELRGEVKRDELVAEFPIACGQADPSQARGRAEDV